MRPEINKIEKIYTIELTEAETWFFQNSTKTEQVKKQRMLKYGISGM